MKLTKTRIVTIVYMVIVLINVLYISLILEIDLVARYPGIFLAIFYLGIFQIFGLLVSIILAWFHKNIIAAVLGILSLIQNFIIIMGFVFFLSIFMLILLIVLVGLRNESKSVKQAANKVISNKKEETVSYIKQLPLIYDQISFSQIRKKTGIKSRDVRDIVEKMILNKQIAAKIAGNDLIFLKTEINDENKGVIVTPPVIPTSTSGSQLPPQHSVGLKGISKEKLWIAALTGVLFNILSLLAPAASVMVIGIVYYWMWGLVVAATHTEITLNLSGIYGITCSIFIVILGLYIIYSANKVRLGNSSIEDESKIWIIISIITIILNIVWIILIETHQYFSWSVAFPGFAIVGIFIGSGLILIAGIASR